MPHHRLVCVHNMMQRIPCACPLVLQVGLFRRSQTRYAAKHTRFTTRPSVHKAVHLFCRLRRLSCACHPRIFPRKILCSQQEESRCTPTFRIISVVLDAQHLDTRRPRHHTVSAHPQLRSGLAVGFQFWLCLYRFPSRHFGEVAFCITY